MAEECNIKNVRFIDAPVAGSRQPAENGELIFLIGGDTDDVKTVRHLFDIMGKKTIHCGKAGNGSAMKMVVNSMLGASVACFSEAISLGKSMGLNETGLFDTLLATPVTAPILQLLRPKLEARNEDPNFPLKHMRKDLHLAALTGYEENVSLPILNIIKEIYAQVEQKGKGDHDFSSIFNHIVQD
jgi:3-hydroxyisobutyrate dehydrogenase/glyoxylate/succinic semialdehyde reductase